MGSTLTINGSRELMDALQRKAKMAAAKEAVKDNTAALQRNTQMKETQVYVKGYSHGQTRQSTGLAIGYGGMSGVVGMGMDYDPYLETGTRFMAAEPALKPSFLTQKIQFINDLKRLVK